jgi:hypothetical protein
MMFPKKAILGAALLLSAGSVLANTADLRVIGTIAPPACTPTFAGGGLVDYGNISQADLSATAETALSPHNVTYSISCSTPAPIILTWSDARSGTVASGDSAGPGVPSDFGLNTHNGVNIGRYQMLPAAGATGDSNPSAVLVRVGTSGAWSATDGNVHYATNRQFTFGVGNTTVPGAFSNYTGSVRVTGYITPRRNLNLSTEATLDGLSTMTVNYL